MSDYHRFKRLVKSIIPKFPPQTENHYSLEEARMMINELGYNITPGTLAYLVDSDTILDDFIMSLYDLERDIRRRVGTPVATIDPALEPRVYEEKHFIGFTVTYKGEEIVFAEYPL